MSSTAAKGTEKMDVGRMTQKSAEVPFVFIPHLLTDQCVAL